MEQFVSVTVSNNIPFLGRKRYSRHLSNHKSNTLNITLKLIFYTQELDGLANHKSLMNFNFPSTKGNLEAQGLTHSSFVKKVSSAGAHSPASKSPVQTMFFASAYYPSSLVLSIQVASENYFVLLVSLSP